jgi:hypothetical protein
MWEALEQLAWVKTFGTTYWMYATVSVIHYLTMFWFIGSIVIVDLRVMELAARKRNLMDLARQLLPWAWTGFSLAIVSGFLMFTVDAGDWAPDPYVHIKLGMILVSTAFAIIIQRGIPRWAQAAEIPTSAKIMALISIILWILTILSATEIPAMEGLG